MFEAIIAELNRMKVSELSRRRLCDVTAGIGHVRGALDALEVKVVAAVDDLDDAGGDAESMLRSEGRCSKREARRRARRADKLRNMPNTSKKLADGKITAEHADELAKAAAATSEADVDDDERLLNNATRRPADMAARDIRDWVGRRQSNADREQRHRRQREQRSLSIFDGDDGMTVAHCRTDTFSGEQFRARIEELARRLYRDDGGRDGPQPGATQRSWAQLRHDALMILLGIDTNGAETSAEPDSERPTPQTRSNGSARNQVMVIADADVIAGANPDGRIEIPGVGRLPANVLERLMCDAEILGTIFASDGQPLWLGRGTRTVTPAQWQALVARDQGCVICAAHSAHCQAHHIVPWAQHGRTDLANLALLCVRHHHELHDHNLRLVRDPTDRWILQPRAGPTQAAA